MRGFWVLLAVMAAAVVIAGCGGQGSDTTAETSAVPDRPTQEVTVTLSGWKGPEIAGIVMAERLGYFTEAGLQVFPYVPTTTGGSVPDVAAGADDFGISYQPQVAMSVEEGEPIVAVASLVPQPTAAMIWTKESGIDGIAGLKGKKIAISGLPFQQAFLKKVLAHSGLSLEDVKIEDVGKELVSALTSGRADAIFGGSWNVEGVELEARGLDPVITKVEDLGFPGYEEFVVIANPRLVAEDPQMVRKFTSAIARGTRAAIEDPRAAAKAIGEASGADPEASPQALLAEVEATFPLLSADGRMSPGRAKGLVAWMHEEGMIGSKPPVSALLAK